MSGIVIKTKVFVFAPSYLSSKGDGLHERWIAREISRRNLVFVAAFKTILSPSIDFESEIVESSETRKVMFLPALRPLFLLSFLYSLFFSFIFTCYRLVGRKPFEVIYVRDNSAALGFNLFKGIHGIPIVLKIVSFTIDEFFMSSSKNAGSRLASWLLSSIERFAVVKSDKILVPSNLFKTELISRHNPSSGKITVISVGVDINKFNILHENRASNAPFTLGYFGSLIQLNDIDCLLKSIHILKPKVDVKLILSTQSNPSEVKKTINSLSLAKQVEIRRTPYDLMPTLLSEVDAVVIPRRKLSSTDLVFPLKLLEAGAARKPVIIAKTKIVEYELQDKKHVVMYRPESSEDLASKIFYLYNDRNLQYNISNAFFDYVKNYDWDIIGDRLRQTLNLTVKDSENTSKSKTML
jgi:glycosyltransferase involved in cell wall biosynthesis